VRARAAARPRTLPLLYLLYLLSLALSRHALRVTHCSEHPQSATPAAVKKEKQVKQSAALSVWPYVRRCALRYSLYWRYLRYWLYLARGSENATLSAAPSAWMYFYCCGLLGIGCAFLFAWIAQYYTDYAYKPVRQVRLTLLLYTSL